MLRACFGPTRGPDGLQTRDRRLQTALQHGRVGLRTFPPRIARGGDAKVGDSSLSADVIGGEVMRLGGEFRGRVPLVWMIGTSVDFFDRNFFSF